MIRIDITEMSEEEIETRMDIYNTIKCKNPHYRLDYAGDIAKCKEIDKKISKLEETRNEYMTSYRELWLESHGIPSDRLLSLHITLGKMKELKLLINEVEDKIKKLENTKIRYLYRYSHDMYPSYFRDDDYYIHKILSGEIIKCTKF